MSRTLAQQCIERRRKFEIFKNSQCLGISYEELKTRLEQEKQYHAVATIVANKVTTESLPQFFDEIMDHLASTFPQLMERTGNSLLMRAARQIAREVARQLPASVLALPAEEVQEEIKKTIKRIPFNDIDSILEQVSLENSNLV